MTARWSNKGSSLDLSEPLQVDLSKKLRGRPTLVHWLKRMSFNDVPVQAIDHCEPLVVLDRRQRNTD